MCTHFTPLTAILIDVLWDTFSIGGLLPLERCQRSLLYPLTSISSICRCNWIWFFTFRVKAGPPGFSKWRRPYPITLSTVIYLFILWCFSGLKWNIGLLKTIWRLRRSLKKLLCGFRTIIIIATIGWSDFFAGVSVTSWTGYRGPSSKLHAASFSLEYTCCIRSPDIFLLIYSFRLIVGARILSILFDGTSLAPRPIWSSKNIYYINEWTNLLF